MGLLSKDLIFEYGYPRVQPGYYVYPEFVY
jgi:hypothetical protein